MAETVNTPVAERAGVENSVGGELRVLSRQECVRLLRGQRMGRLAFSVRDQAKIFPVDYIFDGTSVVARTGEGFKLAEAPMRKVAFEIDAAAEDGEWGWSVVVEGPCYNVTSALDDTSEQARGLPVHVWAPGEREKWLRIDPAQMSGRAFGAVPVGVPAS